MSATLKVRPRKVKLPDAFWAWVAKQPMSDGLRGVIINVVRKDEELGVYAMNMHFHDTTSEEAWDALDTFIAEYEAHKTHNG